MPYFEMKESRRQLTSYAGLSLIGQCFEVAGAAPWLDGHLPVSGGMKTSDIAKSMIGLQGSEKIMGMVSRVGADGIEHGFRGYSLHL